MTEREFLERIARSSDLDTVRVYADWLLEQGSSRAEFVEIQLRRAKHKSLPGDDVRARALLHDHWRDWLGTAAEIIEESSLRFEHGVLRECRLRDPDNGDVRKLALEQPQFLTVRRLDCGTFQAEYAAKLVTGLPTLWTLMASTGVLRALTRRPEHLEALMAIERPAFQEDWAGRAWLVALSAWNGAPRLRSLDIGPLTSPAEIDEAIELLRTLPPGRGTQTLRAELRADAPGMEERQLPERVSDWLFQASTVATEGVDARTAFTRAWLLPGGGLRFSRLELETFTPYDAAKLLDRISYSGIRHLLLRSSAGEAGVPEPGGVQALSDALSRWRGRGIEIVVPDGWILRLPP